MSIRLKSLLKEGNILATTTEQLPDGTSVEVQWDELDKRDVRSRVDVHDYEAMIYGGDQFGNVWMANVEMTDNAVAQDPENAELKDPKNFHSPKNKMDEYEMQQGVQRQHAVGQPENDKYLVTLRNDAAGRIQLNLIKKALGDQYIIKPRGRHHDRKELLGTQYKPGTQNEVPLDQAEFLAVYLYPKQQHR